HSVEHDPFISKAIHEARVDVNKDGIEAAAYTIIEMDDESAPVGPVLEKWVIKLDRPFHYGIMDSLGYPLFLGTVNTAK
ncbi:MAG: serpin family protein, partial [Bacilli bacterium]|nr:serpin family protein [Bacilli bacterium]